METVVIAPGLGDGLSRVIERIMNVSGVTGYVWFSVYLLVSFIDNWPF